MNIVIENNEKPQFVKQFPCLLKHAGTNQWRDVTVLALTPKVGLIVKIPTAFDIYPLGFVLTSAGFEEAHWQEFTGHLTLSNSNVPISTERRLDPNL